MYNSASKILSLSHLLNRVHAWRLLGDNIVFTNGCFDLLHVGHVEYLEKARQLGQRLVVGLNSDESVRVLKGPARPICEEQARAKMLAALQFVDAVVIFEEDTPANLMQALRPEIWVKGGDYDLTVLSEYKVVTDYGGKALTIPFVDGYSTSKIVEKILYPKNAK